MFKQGELVPGGRYRIEATAGERKSCVLFKATRVSDGASVALRLLAPFVKKQPHVVARLRSRAEFVMGLEHPNLMPVLDVREDLDSFMVVESWFEAIPLLRVVRGKGACSPYETAWVAGQLARGVDHLISSEAPGFDFTLSDVYADIGDLRRESEFFSMTVDRWPGLAIRLSPLALDGDGVPIDAAARYRLDPEHGPRRMLSDRGRSEREDAATGRALLALGEDRLPDEDDLAGLRRALRPVLAHHLGGRGLKSWQLMGELGRLARSASEGMLDP